MPGASQLREAEAADDIGSAPCRDSHFLYLSRVYRCFIGRYFKC
jgi:hypothetical protein